MVVPQPIIERALCNINASLGKGINVADYHRMKDNPNLKHAHFCPDISGSDCIRSLFSSSCACTLVESLLGIGRLSLPHAGQIALVHPKPESEHSHQTWFTQQHINNHKAWHIDGIHTAEAGWEKPGIYNFSILFGVYLSAATRPMSGNFTVFPGGHLMMQQHIQQHSPESLLIHGLPNLALPPPRQLCVNPGDVVIAHYQLPHTVAPNVSPYIRHAVYFRLTHNRRVHHEFNRDALLNVWSEYEGVWEQLEMLYGPQEWITARRRENATRDATETQNKPSLWKTWFGAGGGAGAAPR